MGFRRRLYFAGIATGVIALIICVLLPYSLWLIGLLSLAVGALFVVDRRQRDDPVRRNYPVLGRLHRVVHWLRMFWGWSQPRAPFSAPVVELVGARAAGADDVSAFGAQLPGQRLEILHSIRPADVHTVDTTVVIGRGSSAYRTSMLNISALAFGAISNPAIEALSRAARDADFFYNTGEAGIAPAFWRGGGDLVWQIGTGYFGCRTRDGRFDPAAFASQAAREQVRMIEVKLSQGSKPAKGGFLLGEKITPEVAEICQIPAGEDSILLPYHTAFETPMELLEFIARLRELGGNKPVGMKLCVGQRSDFLAICKAMLRSGIRPDFITVDGSEGGTGAAPVEFQSSVGMPLARSLPFVDQVLLGMGLRDEITVIASGKIVTGADMVSAIARGADACASARAFMLAMGCIQALTCESNTCPAGIATQDPRLTRGIVIETQAQRVRRYQRATVESFRALVAATGCTSPRELGPQHVEFGAGSTKRITLPKGGLAAGEIPEFLAADWSRASADRFRPANRSGRSRPYSTKKSA